MCSCNHSLPLNEGCKHYTNEQKYVDLAPDYSLFAILKKWNSGISVGITLSF